MKSSSELPKDIMDNFQNDVIAGGGWSLAGKSEYLACVGLMNEVIRHEQMQTNYRRSFVPGFWRDNDTTNEDNNHTHTRALLSLKSLNTRLV